MITRRDLLRSTGTGLGLLGLYGLLGDTGALANDTTPPDPRNPLGPRPPHFPARVKHVIHVYLNGGPSQVDTFDPKPLLKKYEGTTLPQGTLTPERKTGAAEERMIALYRLALARSPSPLEAQAGLRFIESTQAGSQLTAWQQYAQVLLLTNEMMFVD